MLINNVNKSAPVGLFHGGLFSGCWKGYGDNGQEVTIHGIRDFKLFYDKTTMQSSEIIQTSITHRVEYFPFGALFA